MIVPGGDSPGQEGNDGALLLTSLPKEVVVMTDYELLSLVIMIIMLVFAALSFYKNDR